MSIANYSDLQTSVANWLHRSDLTTIIPDLVLLGEVRLMRELRCKEMETALNVTISSGVATVPTDYLDMKSAYIDGTPVSKLDRATADLIYDQYPLRSSNGKPKKIAREGSNFIFGPFPDSNYTVKGIYFAKPTSIQTSANSTFLAHPDLYLWAALSEAAPYLKNDARLIVWEQKLSDGVAKANSLANDFGGGGLAVVVA